MRYARRVDANHKAIMDIYRVYGATVIDVSRLPGFCDLVVGYLKQNFLVEVKDGAKFKSQQKLTKKEAEFHANWQGCITIIKNEDEAADHIRHIRQIARLKQLEPY